MMTFLGDREFVVDLTQHSAVFQAELVALIEGRVAHRTRETVHVEHQVTCPHHHFGEQDGGLAPGAAFHPEQPAKTARNFMQHKKHQKCSLLSFSHNHENVLL